MKKGRWALDVGVTTRSQRIAQTEKVEAKVRNVPARQVQVGVDPAGTEGRRAWERPLQPLSLLSLSAW